jgi:hypothetical protein
MSDKITLKEKLAFVDMGLKEVWDEMTPEQQKHLKSEFFILNRYVSSISNQPRDIQEHFILTVNEYFNKHWNTLQKHPKLLWMLLCMCNYDGEQIFWHEWIGYKKKVNTNSKKIKLLEELYPNRKLDEVELLSKLMTDKEIKDLARSYGMDEATIAKKLK